MKANFYAGRIKPGKFEYPLLNGWMLTEEAKSKCENDLACGGFTFKGRQIVILQFSYEDIHNPCGHGKGEGVRQMSILQHKTY